MLFIFFCSSAASKCGTSVKPTDLEWEPRPFTCFPTQGPTQEPEVCLICVSVCLFVCWFVIFFPTRLRRVSPDVCPTLFAISSPVYFSNYVFRDKLYWVQKNDACFIIVIKFGGPFHVKFNCLEFREKLKSFGEKQYCFVALGNRNLSFCCSFFPN